MSRASFDPCPVVEEEEEDEEDEEDEEGGGGLVRATWALWNADTTSDTRNADRMSTSALESSPLSVRRRMVVFAFREEGRLYWSRNESRREP